MTYIQDHGKRTVSAVAVSKGSRYSQSSTVREVPIKWGFLHCIGVLHPYKEDGAIQGHRRGETESLSPRSPILTWECNTLQTLPIQSIHRSAPAKLQKGRSQSRKNWSRVGSIERRVRRLHGPNVLDTVNDLLARYDAAERALAVVQDGLA
jgi:hypothetical protein